MGQNFLQSKIVLQFFCSTDNKPRLQSRNFFKGFLLLIFLSLSLFVRAQVATYPSIIKGKVSDETQVGIPGVVITVKSSNVSTRTNENGEYNIRVNKSTDVLVFSFIGFQTVEKLVAGLKVIDVTLKESVSELNEVVVVGYGTQNRRDLTTAVSKVSTKNAEEGGYNNFQQMIGGRAAGVQVSENSSEPGGAINIEIRGASSLSLSTQPLYVIDGLPLETPNLNLLSSSNTSAFFSSNGNANAAATTNPLSMINPNDIESIEILKDAAATAIYGSRGSNGVVLVTTKSGKTGKTKVSLNYNQGYVNPQKKVDVLEAKDYATYVNEGWNYRKFYGGTTLSADLPFTDEEIAILQTYDHQSELEKAAVSRDLAASLSGGTSGANGGTKYYLSSQYYDQQGVIPGTSLKKINGKLSLESALSSKLKFNGSLSVNTTNRTGQPTQNLIGRALAWAPNSPLTNPDGEVNRIGTYLYGAGDGVVNDPTWGNIYYNARNGSASALAYVNAQNAVGTGGINNPLLFTYDKGVRNVNKATQVLANANFIYNISNSFKASAQIGFNQFNSLLENYIPIRIVPIYGTQRGEAVIGNSQNNSVLYQLSLNYNKVIRKDHSVTAVLVASAEEFTSKTQRVSTSGFISDITGYNSLSAGSTPGIPNSDYNNNALASLISRVTYSYKGKYIMNASGRYDGSSKFAEVNKYGFFPMVSLAWNADKENWFESLNAVISELKIRSSWGLVGNQGISPYSTLSTLSASGAVWGNNGTSVTFSPTRLANPNLKWERTKSANIGLELGFFKDRISVTADVYKKRTEDLFFNVKPPLTSGYTSMFDNIATLSNEGLELSLYTKVIAKKNWALNVNANIAFNQNNIEKLSGAAGEFYVDGAIGTGGYITRIEVGQPLGRFFGYKTEGIWNDESFATKPTTFQANARVGDRRYMDLNKDGLLNDADRTYIGSALPKYFGGFSTLFRYKSFELSTFFSYSVGSQVFNYFEISYPTNGIGNIKKSTFDNRYRMIYPTTDPVLAEQYKAQNLNTKVSTPGTMLEARESTDYYIEDASFLRCRDISLSYRLPQKFIKPLKIESLRVYANVQNLFTITNYTGFNPEVNTGTGLVRGLDNGSAPISRTVRLGLSLNF